MEKLTNSRKILTSNKKSTKNFKLENIENISYQLYDWLELRSYFIEFANFYFDSHENLICIRHFDF